MCHSRTDIILFLLCVQAVTSAELKPESQSSTLPRAGRSGKNLQVSATANVPSGNLPGCSNQQTNAVAAAGEATGIYTKRRSAAHMYRMQTESSLAKVNAAKDSSSESSSSRSSLGKKESYTMLRFPSTPNIATEAPEVDSSIESVKNSHRPRSVEDSDESRSLPMDGCFKADNSSGLAAVKNRADDASQLIDAGDRTLMPPPLSTSVPLSYQATFIAKAAKHRRTTMPESLGRSRELLAGAVAKHHRMSESSSATDGDDSPPSSSSACKSSVPSTQTLDTSPFEPPERDIHRMQNRVDNVQMTDPSARNMSSAECTNITGMKAEHSDSASSADSSVTGSPKIIKIGRCVSPVRPHSASSTSRRRQLPLDPRQSHTVIHSSAEHAAALDVITSCAVPQHSVLQSASVESGKKLTESAICQPTSTGRLSAESSTDTLQRRIPQIEQGPVTQQNSGQRPIASITETRLVLNTECDNAQNLAYTAQQTIINEIERYCTERRMSADLSNQLADHQEQHAADGSQSLSPVGHSRQQWEKTKSVKPLIFKSQSNSSISQTASSSMCDSSVLADVSSLSRNSVNSASSSSGLAYDVAAVTASVSDTVVSYGSAVQIPSKLSSTAAFVTTDTKASLHSDDNEAVEGEQLSVLKLPTCTDSLGQPLSAMSSDK